MILSFWWMSLELFRELLRWIEEGGANDPPLSRLCDELLREGLLRKLAMPCQLLLRCIERLKTYMSVIDGPLLRRWRVRSS